MVILYNDGDVVSENDVFAMRLRIWKDLLVLTYSPKADNFQTTELVRGLSSPANNAAYTDSVLSSTFKQSPYYAALATESQIRAAGGVGGYDATGAFDNSGTNIAGSTPTKQPIYLAGMERPNTNTTPISSAQPTAVQMPALSTLVWWLLGLLSFLAIIKAARQ